MEFKPYYNNVIKDAKNIRADRMPLYEHVIGDEVMKKITVKNFASLEVEIEMIRESTFQMFVISIN